MTFLRILLASPYNLFFVMAILVGVALAVREAHARGFPLRDWSVVLAMAVVGGLIGSKLVFLDFRPIAPGEKTILGAILVGAGAVLFAARALRIGAWRTLDALAVPTLAAMAVGRVGCFVAGCCAGTETVLPWGVRPARGDAHVHPVQLYEMAADLLLIAALRRWTGRRWDGARFFAASLGYAAIRIGTEFVRAGREIHAGLNAVQWSLFVIAVALGALALRRSRAVVREARAVRDVRVTHGSPRAPLRARQSLVAAFGVAGGFALLTIATADWLVPLERMTVLAVAGALVASAAFAAMPRWLPRAIPLLLAPRLGAFVVQDSTVERGPRREILIGGAVRNASYDQLVGREYGSDCDGNPSSWPTLAHRDAQVTEASAGVRQRRANGGHITVEGRYLSGTDRLGSIDSGPVTEIPVPRLRTNAGGASFEIEGPATTMRFGVTSGRLSGTGVLTNSTTPSFMLRAGDDKRFFFQASLADKRYFATLGEFSYLGLGITAGRGRPRAMLGIGEGGIMEVFLPLKQTEFDLTWRSVSTKDDGSGGGSYWTAGIRQAITIRR